MFLQIPFVKPPGAEVLHIHLVLSSPTIFFAPNLVPKIWTVEREVQEAYK